MDRQPVDERKLRALLQDLVRHEMSALGTESVPAPGGQKLAVGVAIHLGDLALPDPNAAPRALELHVIWPRKAVSLQQIRVWAAQYGGAPHVALWVVPGGAEAEELARKAVKLEGAIQEYSRREGAHAVGFLSGEQARLDGQDASLIAVASVS